MAVILTVLCGLIALVWVSRNIMVGLQANKGFVLDESYPSNPARQPLVSVVIAAKDEEDNIDPCLRTMLDQDYPNYEMILCNDRSTDRTAEIARGLAARNPRLRVIDITQLPEGWAGKNNAMQTGIAQSQGDWICMIDADCRQTSRHTLSAAVQYAQDTATDMLSVLPTLEMHGFWENVVQPVCAGLMMIWFHPDKVNSPKYPNAYANGAFMLIRRAAYQQIGTHQAVRDRVNEDIHLAGRVKQAGLKLRVVSNHGLFLSRMYTSLPQIFRGWARIFFGTFGTLRRIGMSLAALVIVSLLPYPLAALGLILAVSGARPHGAWLACGIAGLVAVACQFVAIFRFYRLVGARTGLTWTYPIGCVVTVLSLISAIGKLRKGAKIVWRNTSYVTPGAGGAGGN